ncbi:MAG: UDP-N-acetylmuramate dehydrogenase [Desulfobacter sp.]
MTPADTHKPLFKGLDVETNVPMARYTSFRVGGPADFLALPRRIETLVSLAGTARDAGMPITFLGGGTNTLVSDKGIRGLVIVLTALKKGPELQKPNAGEDTRPIVRMSALAGERLSTLCRTTVENGLSGLEWAAGIPGTLGGAVMMNAGAHGSDMTAVVTTVEVLNLDTMQPETLNRKDLAFGYRKLDLPGRIILAADLSLAPADPGQVKHRYAQHLKSKKDTQPVSKASGGCFFKNPSPEQPAGRLIEQAGLKGYTHNGAMVSDLHANFIVNTGNAACEDILALKQMVQARVHERFNIKLETEVKTIGD